jgi:5-formyltetrahydrofolate cyclo-ligase
MSKLSLRKKLRTARMQLSDSYRLQAELDLTQLAISSHVFKNADKIAAYLSINNEINPQLLLDHCLQASKKCFVPIIDPSGSKSGSKKLIFSQYTSNTTLIKNKFGILEPVFNHNKKNLIPTLDLSLILLPVVGFDKFGHRLGMGGGYYDETLSSIKDQDVRPTLIGLAYAMQEVDDIPTNIRDINLDAILTDKEYRQFTDYIKKTK